MTYKASNDASTKFNVLGVKVSSLTNFELLNYISDTVRSGKRCTILSGNIHSYNLAYNNIWLREFMNTAEIIRLDGFGVRLAALLLGKTTPPRSTWADFGWQLAEFTAKQGFSLYFLGAKPGVVEEAIEKLSERYPELRVAGCHHGYFNKTIDHSDTIRIIEEINKTTPDILIIGLGMPIQERWLSENRSKLNVNVVMTGGAVFDYLSGDLKRAPKWMTDNGLEWLGRMMVEPGRLWRRYLIGGPLFLSRVILQRFGLLRY